ncbi:glycosyltransferase family 2 protein [Olivibacter sp. CPCC 100613]|uniref:glycosyltransferase family 2 protein n=1 Tax=Olivibacter sp. CPCC 100613 TaxID=3079931 RepID=UPI002FF54752
MDTCAILVLYNPAWELLSEVLNGIRVQCSYLLVIDNSDQDHQHRLSSMMEDAGIPYEYVALLQNKGIAAAQNIGINMARRLSADFVVFFDQDSVPAPKMVQYLLEAHRTITVGGIQVGGLGPRSVSRETGKKYEAKFDKGNILAGQDYTVIRQLISSGSMVSLKTFDRVGLFLEEMFIDLVDFEWCWRANKIGYRHFIIEQALMQHMFGASEKRVMGFRISVPSAFRIYFQFRNYLWLVTKEYVPVYWKVSAGIKLVIKFVLLPLVGAQPLAYFKRSIKGIADGLFKRRI